MSKRENLIGELFGSYYVLNKIHNDKRGQYYQCLCLSCEKILSVRGSALTSGGAKQCKKCAGKNQFQGTGNISLSYFNKIKRHAKNRNLEFNIQILDIWNLFLKQKERCALTNVKITLNKEYRKHTQTASLDRIDSNKGYTIDNVQWVHKNINWLKNDMDQEVFIQMCNNVAKQHPR